MRKAAIAASASTAKDFCKEERLEALDLTIDDGDSDGDGDGDSDGDVDSTYEPAKLPP